MKIISLFAYRIMFFIWLIAGLSTAHANCVSGQAIPVPISINFGSHVTIPITAPVGSTIASIQLPPTGQLVASCTNGGGYLYYNMFLQPSNIPHVYKTNLEGVGILLKTGRYFENPPSKYQYGASAGWVNNVWDSSYKTVSLVKTGDITPGSLQSTKVGSWYADDRIEPMVFTLTAGAVISQSCVVSTPNVNVPLDDVVSSDLTAIGSTAKPKPFNVELICDKSVPIYFTANGITDPDAGSDGVLKNTETSGAASGVGVQIIYNGTPLKLNNKLQVTTSPSGQENLQFSAQYYKTKNTAFPGTVRAIMTIDISYM
ncbi:fimbrial protein [Serratia sp. JSRIV004]|uniref:fimbrial protein n=1 Tax=unclassified Serratia (in: enterobacteria) TaxID=2647522 RepID=UPI001CBCEF7E|nr:fimbrial protein [Serratia sp. JSRIV004]UAN58523.1 fimbrial protein [Serratia sp. JSRIV004]